MGRRRVSRVHGVLVIDKPRGPTSHDVVSWVRRALGTRAVGHAGTLDPMATGVLVVAVGEGTKLLRWLTADDKCYRATVALGAETDTLDAEGQVVETAASIGVTLQGAREAARAFVGTYLQRPPIFSAIKVDGEPLYEKARRGEVVEVPEREVTVHRLEILAATPAKLELDLMAAKGFYVRALGRDLARSLETRGHLTALRRTRSGPFEEREAFAGDRLEAARDGDIDARRALVDALLPLDQACRSMLRVALDDEQVAHAHHGRPIPLRGELDLPETDDPLALVGPKGRLVAVGARSGDGLRVLRGIRLPAPE